MVNLWGITNQHTPLKDTYYQINFFFYWKNNLRRNMTLIVRSLYIFQVFYYIFFFYRWQISSYTIASWFHLFTSVLANCYSLVPTRTQTSVCFNSTMKSFMRWSCYIWTILPLQYYYFWVIALDSHYSQPRRFH